MVCPVLYLGRLILFTLLTLICIPAGLLWVVAESMKEELVVFYPEWKGDFLKVLRGESFL